MADRVKTWGRLVFTLSLYENQIDYEDICLGDTLVDVLDNNSEWRIVGTERRSYGEFGSSDMIGLAVRKVPCEST